MGPNEGNKMKELWKKIKAAADPRSQAIELKEGFRWEEYAVTYADPPVEGDERDIALMLFTADVDGTSDEAASATEALQNRRRCQ